MTQLTGSTVLSLSVVLCCVVLCCVVLCCVVLCCVVLYCIVLYCIVLYCIVLCCVAGATSCGSAWSTVEADPCRTSTTVSAPTTPSPAWDLQITSV